MLQAIPSVTNALGRVLHVNHKEKKESVNYNGKC